MIHIVERLPQNKEVKYFVRCSVSVYFKRLTVKELVFHHYESKGIVTEHTVPFHLPNWIEGEGLSLYSMYQVSGGHYLNF